MRKFITNKGHGKGKSTIQRCFDYAGGTWICQLSSEPQKTARQRPQIIGKEDHKGNL